MLHAAEDIQVVLDTEPDINRRGAVSRRSRSSGPGASPQASTFPKFEHRRETAQPNTKWEDAKLPLIAISGRSSSNFVGAGSSIVSPSHSRRRVSALRRCRSVIPGTMATVFAARHGRRSRVAVADQPGRRARDGVAPLPDAAVAARARDASQDWWASLHPVCRHRGAKASESVRGLRGAVTQFGE